MKYLLDTSAPLFPPADYSLGVLAGALIGIGVGWLVVYLAIQFSRNMPS